MFPILNSKWAIFSQNEVATQYFDSNLHSFFSCHSPLPRRIRFPKMTALCWRTQTHGDKADGRWEEASVIFDLVLSGLSEEAQIHQCMSNELVVDADVDKGESALIMSMNIILRWRRGEREDDDNGVIYCRLPPCMFIMQILAARPLRPTPLRKLLE